MNDHTLAILNQLPAEEKAFYEKDPAAGWLAQMGARLSTMTIPDGVAFLRAEASGLKSLPQPAPGARPNQPLTQSPREPHEPSPPTAIAQPTRR